MGEGLFIFLSTFGRPLLLALPIALSAPLTAAFARTPLARRIPLLSPLTFAGVVALIRFAESFFPATVPFASCAIMLTPLPALCMTCSLFGSYFLVFLLAAVNGLLGFGAACLPPFSPLPGIASRSREGLRRRLRSLPERLRGGRCVLPLVLAAALFAGNLLAGGVLLLLPEETDTRVRVGVVQGNISARQQWSEEGVLDRTFAVYEEGTTALAQAGAELVLWPESVINVAIYPGSDAYRRLQETVARAGCAVMAGTLYAEDGNQYNSCLLLHPDGTVDDARYDKRHIVPFGEYIPLQGLVSALLPPLRGVVESTVSLSRGAGSHVSHTRVGWGCLICFDSVYPDVAREATAEGAQILLLPTNDSWFGLTPAEETHFRHGVLRAMENGRYVVRAATTGASGLIFPKGVVTNRIACFEEGTFLADVPAYTHKTLYTRMGDAFLLLPGVLLVCQLLSIPYYIWKERKQHGRTHSGAAGADPEVRE